MERRLRRSIALLVMVCAVILVGIAFADEEDALEMETYWRLVGTPEAKDPLSRAMNGDASLSLQELKTVSADELLSFAAAYKLPIGMPRCAWYSAMAQALAAELPQTPLGETLGLFLEMRESAKDKAANEQRREIRKSLTQQDILDYAAETGLPAGFLAWLMLDDEWYEHDWEEGDDWREGRRSWDFADWVDEQDLRERYGAQAVVTEEDVEKVLRQNGYHFDD